MSSNKPSNSGLRQFFYCLGICLAIAAFVGTRIYFYFNLSPSFTDLYLYSGYAMNGVDLELKPYADFPFEYPPAAYYAIALPRWIASEKLTLDDLKNQRHRSAVDDYFRVFRLEMFLCDLAAFGLFLATVHKRRPEFLGWSGICYVFATGILNEVLYDRFDAGLLLLLMLWAFLFVSSWREKVRILGWSVASYAVLGFGVAYKLIPLVAFPLLAVMDLKSVREVKGISRLVASWAAFSAAAFVPFVWPLMTTGKSTFNFLGYHAERGIEIESIHASLLIVLSWFGVPVRALHDYGCWNVETILSDISKNLATASTLLGMAVVFSAFVWLCFQPRRNIHAMAYRLAIWVVIATVAVAKVLSVQYLIWLLPLILLLGVEICKRWEFAALSVVTIVMALLTAWVFPYHFTPDYIAGGLHLFNEPDFALIPDLGYWPCLALLVRNLLLLSVVGFLGWKIVTSKAHESEIHVTSSAA